MFFWLRIMNLFQTFADLESIKDEQADIQVVRQALDEDRAAQGEEVVGQIAKEKLPSRSKDESLELY